MGFGKRRSSAKAVISVTADEKLQKGPRRVQRLATQLPRDFVMLASWVADAGWRTPLVQSGWWA